MPSRRLHGEWRYTSAGNLLHGDWRMEKLDLKKQWKHLYQPKADEIVTVDVPPLTYLMVDGEGDPNVSQSFQEAVEALYSLSYTLKFSLKKSPRAIDYGVMPLEGLWWADDPQAFILADKASWKWTVMILQPEFIAKREVDAAFAEVRKKKNPAALDRVRFESLTEGRSGTAPSCSTARSWALSSASSASSSSTQAATSRSGLRRRRCAWCLFRRDSTSIRRRF